VYRTRALPVCIIVSCHIVGFEAFTAIVVNVATFWDIALCRPYTGSILPSHLLHSRFLLGRFATMKMEVMRSSETSVHVRTTRHYIPYCNLTVWSRPEENNNFIEQWCLVFSETTLCSQRF
jgi:hypothetical protein